MRWTSQWIFLRNAVKCGELFFSPHSPHFLHKFATKFDVVNFAVNFRKKCGEMRWNIYFYRIHGNHRISYKNSPHSPHFLQKSIQKPRPGICSQLLKIPELIKWIGKIYHKNPGRGYRLCSFMTQTVFERTKGVWCVQTYTGEEFFWTSNINAPSTYGRAKVCPIDEPKTVPSTHQFCSIDEPKTVP